MAKNFYISDLHLNHGNVIRFDNRPFSTVYEMENKIVENWNNVVSTDDTVYLLGDIIWSTEPEWIRIMKLLKGNKVLIKGNHDIKHPSAELKNCFADIKDYKEITDNGKHIILCHYPILFYKASYNEDCWHLCGHTHITTEEMYRREFVKELVKRHSNNTENRGHIINVGCMMPYMDYTPRTIDELITWWNNEYGGLQNG